MLQPPTPMDGGEKSIISKKGEEKYDQELISLPPFIIFIIIYQSSFISREYWLDQLYIYREITMRNEHCVRTKNSKSNILLEFKKKKKIIFDWTKNNITLEQKKNHHCFFSMLFSFSEM